MTTRCADCGHFNPTEPHYCESKPLAHSCRVLDERFESLVYSREIGGEPGQIRVWNGWQWEWRDSQRLELRPVPFGMAAYFPEAGR